MLDLSNNNGAHHNFRAAYLKGGQRRVYLKLGEDPSFDDRTFKPLRISAQKAGLKVGAYWFCHPGAVTPAESLQHILRLLPAFKRDGRELRPVLDLEYGTSSPAAGRWASELWQLLKRECGIQPACYGSGYYLQDLQLSKPLGPLWIAAYGRNDGRDYPVTMIPRPWKTVSAHQFTSQARVVGIDGPCDLSHLPVPTAFDVPKRKA